MEHEMTGCGAPVGGVALEGIDVANEAVIQGVVSRAGAPVHGAYVRLLDGSGEFTAEVPTGEDGAFRFFARPGPWTVRALAPGVKADRPVAAVRGEIAELAISL
jgi:Protein of unknown function (DUF1416)